MRRDIMLNVSRRWLMVQEILGASLVTGTDKIASGFGNGDCILVDLHNRVFAVADGTERHTRGSRVLLERFRDTFSRGDRPRTRDEWQAAIQDVFDRQDYHCKTTFSMMALGHTERCGDVAYVFNGGDSMVLAANRENGNLSHASDVDMNFAGRSKIPGPVKECKYNPLETRFILATDGLNDLLRPFNEAFNRTLPSLLRERNPAMIPGMVEERISALKTGYRSYDDVGLLVIDTGYIHEAGRGCVIMGGTTPQQESIFRESLSERHGENLVQLGDPGKADLYGGITVL